MNTATNEDAIDQCLPQTQCTQCGYPRCRDYAAALATGDAELNQCPPGGEETIARLAELLQRPVQALNPGNGEHKPRTVAVIVEAECIGCTKCIQACPVDAIVGAGKLMHTIIEELCTGCELCLPPCPMDCIGLQPYRSRPQYHYTHWQQYADEETGRARLQTELRLARLQRRRQEQQQHKLRSRLTSKTGDAIRADIQAAIQRSKQRRS